MRFETRSKIIVLVVLAAVGISMVVFGTVYISGHVSYEDGYYGYADYTNDSVTAVCSDSDGGRNYTVRGTTGSALVLSKSIDGCQGGQKLKEYYCNETDDSVESETINCTEEFGSNSKCRGGECILQLSVNDSEGTPSGSTTPLDDTEEEPPSGDGVFPAGEFDAINSSDGVIDNTQYVADTGSGWLASVVANQTTGAGPWELKLKLLGAKPDGIPSPPSGAPYKYLYVDHTGKASLFDARTISIPVPNELAGENLTVTLWRYNGSAWHPYSTSAWNKDEKNTYYMAHPIDFSYFAVTLEGGGGDEGELKGNKTEEKTTDKDTDGGVAWWVFLLIGAGTSILMLAIVLIVIVLKGKGKTPSPQGGKSGKGKSKAKKKGKTKAGGKGKKEKKPEEL